MASNNRLENWAKFTIDCLGQAVYGQNNLTFDLVKEIVKINYNKGAGLMASEGFSELDLYCALIGILWPDGM